MKDHQTVDLEEYKQLRAEILARLTLHNQLTSYTVAAIAAALAVFSSYRDVLLALSFLTSWFWLLYSSHDAHIFRIAHYIGTELAPRLKTDEHDVLGWERSWRKTADAKISKTGISTSMAIIFGGSTPVLTAIFWLPQLPVQNFDVAFYGRILATLCAIAMWFNAIYYARLAASVRRQVNTAILTVPDMDVTIASADPRP
jgi:hypothetical protein